MALPGGGGGGGEGLEPAWCRDDPNHTPEREAVAHRETEIMPFHPLVVARKDVAEKKSSWLHGGKNSSVSQIKELKKFVVRRSTGLAE